MNKGERKAARRLHARHVRVLTSIALVLSCGACARFADRFSRGNKMHTGTEQQRGQNGATQGDESNATVQTNAPVVYVALGDSTGVGVGARRGGGYVARLFERIERVRPGSRVVNLCVSGARTDDALRGQVPPPPRSSIAAPSRSDPRRPGIPQPIPRVAPPRETQPAGKLLVRCV